MIPLELFGSAGYSLGYALGHAFGWFVLIGICFVIYMATKKK